MTFARRIAHRISASVAARVPPDRADWANGLARELDAIPSDWAALRWSLGSLRVLLIAPQLHLDSLDEVPKLTKDLRFYPFGTILLCLCCSFVQRKAVWISGIKSVPFPHFSFDLGIVVLLYFAVLQSIRGCRGWSRLKPRCNPSDSALALREELAGRLRYRTSAWWLVESLPFALYLVCVFSMVKAPGLHFSDTFCAFLLVSALSSSLASDLSELTPPSGWRKLLHPWRRCGVPDFPWIAWTLLLIWSIATNFKAGSAAFNAILFALTALWTLLANHSQIDRYRRRIADLDTLLAANSSSIG